MPTQTIVRLNTDTHQGAGEMRPGTGQHGPGLSYVPYLAASVPDDVSSLVGSGFRGLDRTALRAAADAVPVTRTQLDGVARPMVGSDGWRFTISVASGVVALAARSDARAVKAQMRADQDREVQAAARRDCASAALMMAVCDAVERAIADGNADRARELGVHRAALRVRGSDALAAAAAAVWGASAPLCLDELAARTLGALDRRAESERSIREWSRKSRARMVRVCAELDYTPVFEQAGVPTMVTLTLPSDWLAVAPTGQHFKRLMYVWRKRFERAWGQPLRGLWKLEFQRRGAPHLHVWQSMPLGRASGRGVGAGLPYREWLSVVWADVVAHPDPVERAKHEVAGTKVGVRDGLQCSDPKRLAVYFAKHSAASAESSKEYQHVVPEAWQEPGAGPGRFWGYWGLERVRATTELDVEDFIRARRIVRRWSRSQASYGSVAPGDRYPTAVTRRRKQLCRDGGLRGGFAVVNDGAAFATQLGRALEVWRM